MAKAKINPVILCVDDDQTVLQALRSLLEKTLGGQAEIEVAECGQDALDICEDLAEDGRPVSIVISDYIMPNMRGDELLKVRVPGACVCSRRALANHIENWPKVNAIASFQVIHDGRRA